MFTKHSKSDKFDEPRLYHCTKYKALKAILGSKQFLPSYCLERASFMEEYSEGAYAVVCFADLMSNEVGRHMASFHADSYIVMDKQWARRQFIAPVLYYVNGSIPSATLKAWLLKLVEQKEKDEMDDKDKTISNATNMFVPYMKQYEGEYYDKKDNKFSDNKRTFYLEREWRWCPMVENGEAYYLSKEDYLNEETREIELTILRKNYTLNFEWKDIIEIGVSSACQAFEIIQLCAKTYSLPKILVYRKIKFCR